MLAQSFMTHTELGVTAEEHTALIAVLGMLERGELVHSSRNHSIPDGFNMGTCGYSCGTTACIGGWVAALVGKDQVNYVHSHFCGSPIRSLYWPNKDGIPEDKYSGITPAQAAFALRSFLSTGKPNWAEAMA